MDAAQFPFLLKLLDDDSPVVQEEVQRALICLAPQMPSLYQRYPVTWPDRLIIHRILLNWRMGRLLSDWTRWRQETDRHSALECAHATLSDFASCALEAESLSARLDALAEEHRHVKDAQELAFSLFAEKLRGDSASYYTPDNSFLSRVLSRGEGNPISLCSVLILVGKRLGFHIWGCNFPGHFLAILEGPPSPREAPRGIAGGAGWGNETSELCLLDCFHGGRTLGPDLVPELKGSLSTAQLELLCRNEVAVEDIVERVVRNLEAAYRNQERRDQANLFYLLLKDTVARNKGLGEGLSLREPLFQPGQLVSHKEKGYRGAILDYELYIVDPDLDDNGREPLYRILVHGSPQVATARESILVEDKSGGRVAHPLMTFFFSKFEDGVYYRNSKPWEKS